MVGFQILTEVYNDLVEIHNLTYQQKNNVSLPFHQCDSSCVFSDLLAE